MLHLLKITALATVFAINFAVASTSTFIGKTLVKIESIKNSKTLLVDLKDIGNVPIRVCIKNSDGEILTSTYAKGDENTTYRYNLARLEEGTYQVILTTSTAELTQPIKVCRNCVDIYTDQLIEKNKPSFRLVEGMLDINYLNKSQKPISVTIYDEKGNAVLEKTIDAKIDFGRRFDLNKLAFGTYTVAVKTNEEIYSYNFNL